MRVGYAGGERGAREAARRGAAVVVVDALRASATIAVLVALGVRVRPVATVSEALATEADYRAGERGGEKVPGFDFGNSPVEILEAGVGAGSTVALTTTNGTRVIRAASGAPDIFAGCFVNASAMAEALRSRSGEVIVVGCGWRGHRAAEDERAAGSIIARLVEAGAIPDVRAQKVMRGYRERPLRTLYGTSAARRLLSLGYDRDLDVCFAEDSFPVVPVLVDGAFVALRKGAKMSSGALPHNARSGRRISS